mgnify:CR=1 FL=1
MWITLELCALTVLHSSGALGATAAIVLAIILLILLIADMACYLAYCHLPPMPAFIDGTAPLIAVTVFSEIVVAMIVQVRGFCLLFRVIQLCPEYIWALPNL